MGRATRPGSVRWGRCGYVSPRSFTWTTSPESWPDGDRTLLTWLAVWRNGRSAGNGDSPSATTTAGFCMPVSPGVAPQVGLAHRTDREYPPERAGRVVQADPVGRVERRAATESWS